MRKNKFRVLLLTCILGFSLLCATAGAEGRETLLQQARHLLDQGEESRDNLWKAAELLARHREDFPGERLLPLYLAEAWYRMADPEGDIGANWPLYETAEKFAEESLQLTPGDPQSRYWYGLSQLKRAQKKGGVRAYFSARRGIGELEEVHRQLPAFDRAGAARVLALLYTVAPGWSPFGDLAKAIAYGKEAVRYAPDYGLNRLYLAQAYEKAGQRSEAIAQYRTLIDQNGKFAEKAKKKLAELE